MCFSTNMTTTICCFISNFVAVQTCWDWGPFFQLLQLGLPKHMFMIDRKLHYLLKCCKNKWAGSVDYGCQDFRDGQHNFFSLLKRYWNLSPKTSWIIKISTTESIQHTQNVPLLPDLIDMMHEETCYGHHFRRLTGPSCKENGACGLTHSLWQCFRAFCGNFRYWSCLLYFEVSGR